MDRSVRFPTPSSTYDPQAETEFRRMLEELLTEQGGTLSLDTLRVDTIEEYTPGSGLSLTTPRGSIEFKLGASNDVTLRVTPVANTLSFAYKVGSSAFDLDATGATPENFVDGSTPFEVDLGTLAAGSAFWVTVWFYAQPDQHGGVSAPVGRKYQPDVLAGSIDLTKFASGIRPPRIVDVLPATGDLVGDLVFLTTDFKLYRWTGSEWTVYVEASDITGELIASQIADAAITTAKFAAGIRPVRIVSTLGAGEVEDDVVLLTTDHKLYRWTGSAWTAAVPTSDLTGQITTAQLADAAITTAKFAAGIRPVRIVSTLGAGEGDDVVLLTTDHKLYRWTGSAWTAAVPTVDLTGTIATAQIADAAITAAKLGNAAVQTANLALDAVTADIIAANAIETTHITDNAITTAKIAAAQITGAKIAAGTITASNITALTITAAQIAAGTITGAKIAAGTITASNIQALTITAAQIAASTITGAKIAAGTITAANIAADTITAAQIAAGAISASEIAAGAITASKLAVTGVGGTALNIDPNCSDINAWSVGSSGVTVVTIADGQVGTTALRSFPGSYSGGIIDKSHVPVDINKTYRAHAWFRRVGADGRIYLAIRVLKEDGSADLTFSANDGKIYFVSNVLPTDNTWTVADAAYGAGTSRPFSVDSRFVQLYLLLNYSAPTTGYYEVQDFRFEEMTPSTLIKDGAILTQHMTANTIDGDRITAGTLDASKIVADSITAGQIAAGAITASELAAGAVTAGKIAAGVITANEIAALTITGAKIAAGTITADKLVANSITAGQIAAGAIGADEIDADAVTANKIAAGSISATHFASDKITSISDPSGKYIDFAADASGEYFIKHPAFSLVGDGTALFSGDIALVNGANSITFKQGTAVSVLLESFFDAGLGGSLDTGLRATVYAPQYPGDEAHADLFTLRKSPGAGETQGTGVLEWTGNVVVSGDISANSISGPYSIPWSQVTGHPTTIGGYGITDFNSLGDARWSPLSHTHTFASLTSKPTTIAGYGITDPLAYWNAANNFIGLDSFGSSTNSATETGVAIRIRELNYAGAQTGANSEGPRLGFYWSGRISMQLGIDSVGVLHYWNATGGARGTLHAETFFADSVVESPFVLTDTIRAIGTGYLQIQNNAGTILGEWNDATGKLTQLYALDVVGVLQEQGESDTMRRVAKVVVSSAAPTASDHAPDGTIWIKT